MALKFRPGKRKGELKRTTIDPRIGGTRGDAGFGGAPTKRKRKRDDVSPRIGTGKGSDDAGPVGQEARRNKAKINTKGMTPTRKLAKGEGKIRKSDIMGGSKGKQSGPAGPLGAAKSSLKTFTVDGKSIKAKNRQDAISKAKSKNKIDLRKRNLAGSKFGQRKAGGQIKKMFDGGMPGDLNKDGSMSSYEKKRQSAIEKNMGKKGKTGDKMSNKKVRNPMSKMYGGGMTKKKMMGGGMTKKMYKNGGKVKKCKIDGIARKGKTRAGRKK